MGSNYTPHFSKKRELTRFLCQELLYDYVSGALDHDRKLAVEEFLRKTPN